MGPDQYLAAEITDKPRYPGFFENRRVNASNTITQHPHYFTVALLSFRTKGFFNYNHSTLKNVLLCLHCVKFFWVDVADKLDLCKEILLTMSMVFELLTFFITLNTMYEK